MVMDKHMSTKDGRAALLELKEAAMGAESGESAEGLMTRLFSMDSDMDLKLMLQTHYQLVRRIMSFEHVNTDALLKFSLLRLVRGPPGGYWTDDCPSDQSPANGPRSENVRRFNRRLKPCVSNVESFCNH